MKDAGTQSIPQDVPMAWRSGPTWWSLQNRGSPCPRSRAKRGGRAPEAPKGGRRVPRRGDTTRPLDAKPAGGNTALPPKDLPRNASCPSRGRGNERFLLSFIGCARSARLPELSVTRLRAGAAQSFSTMQSARGTRNKKQSLPASQTFRFNLPVSAHSGVFATVRVKREKRHSPPRPSSQSGRAGYSRRGSAPQGEPFPATFRFATKSSPCGAKTNNYCLYRIRSKTSPPCGTK